MGALRMLGIAMPCYPSLAAIAVVPSARDLWAHSADISRSSSCGWTSRTTRPRPSASGWSWMSVQSLVEKCRQDLLAKSRENQGGSRTPSLKCHPGARLRRNFQRQRSAVRHRQRHEHAIRRPRQEPFRQQRLKDDFACCGVHLPQTTCLREGQSKSGHLPKFTTNPRDQ